jgi:hypothetical protein
MARVDAEIDKLEQLAATEVTAVNRLALVREVEGRFGGNAKTLEGRRR